jgi:hypothetical protein
MQLPGGAFMGHAAMHAAGEALRGPLNAIKIVSHMAAPLEYPSASEIIDLHVRQFINTDQLQQGLRRVGVSLDITGSASTPSGISNTLWTGVWFAAQRRQEGAELFEVANRFFWEEGELLAKLAQLGWYDDKTRAQEANLRYDIPGPADLVRFSVRHVWEPDLIASIGYDEEFPGAVIDVWHAMKGLDYKLFTGPFADQIAKYAGSPKIGGSWPEAYALYGLEEPTWARAYWWSHWVLPSAGQGYEMMFRLDPDRNPSFDPPEAKGLEFTFKDLELLLRANDYPQKYRPLLAAIAHRIPGIRFIRDFVKQDVYSYSDLIDWGRRWGYSPRDRKDIADDIWRSVKGAAGKKTACKGCATCDQAFEVGILSRQQLEQCYIDYGMDPTDAARNARLADLKLSVRRGREIVTNVRKRFLRGSLSTDQASQLLQQWGINIGRVQEYLADWQLEFEAGRKELSAAQAVKYACQGIISLDDLVTRLTNLGYPLADQEALVSEATFCAANLAQQAVEKLARKDRQAKADAYQAARRARTSLIEAQRYLASHGSPRDLHSWFCSGNIGEAEVWTRLNAMGWPDVDISRFLSDCKSGRKPTIKSVGATPIIPPLVPPSEEGLVIEGLP